MYVWGSVGVFLHYVCAKMVYPLLVQSFTFSPHLGSVHWFLGPPNVLWSGGHKAQE